MTTFIDDHVTPYLDEKQLAVIAKPAKPLKTAIGDLHTSVLPSGSVDVQHAKVLDAATKKYAKLIQRVAYPYGVNPYTEQPLDPQGKSIPGPTIGSSDIPARPSKGLREKLWKRVYKKAYKKHLGKKMPKGSMPHRPKFKSLRGSGVYNYGTGLTARGIQARGVCARGGSVLATVASLAAPLIIKGFATLAPIVIDAIKKRIEKRKAKKAATIEAGPTEDVQDKAAAQGAGVPTPYQIEQAQAIADKNASEGRIGFPNPLSFPEYPPGMSEIEPVDAMSFWRDVYNKSKHGMSVLAQVTRMPPHIALPLIDKILRNHAKRHFGKGGARMILSSNLRGKPIKQMSLYKVLYPVLRTSMRSDKEDAILKDLLNRSKLNGPTGEGFSDVLETIAQFLLHGEFGMAKDVIGSEMGFGVGLGQYIVDALKSALPSLFSKAPYSAMERLALLMRDIIRGRDDDDDDPAMGSVLREVVATDDPESESEGEGIAARGNLSAAFGGSMWDTIKSLGYLAAEIGAPVLGALAAKRYGTSKGMKKAIELAGDVASEAIGESRMISQLEASQNRALEKLEAKKKELEAAAALTPELYIQLKREAEMGRSKKDKYRYDEDMPSRKWTMEPDEFGKLHRRYTEAYSDILPKSLSRHRDAIRGLFLKDPMEKYLSAATKGKKKKTKMDKLMRRGEKLRQYKDLIGLTQGDARELIRLANIEESATERKYQKKAKKKGLTGEKARKYIEEQMFKYKASEPTLKRAAHKALAAEEEAIFSESREAERRRRTRAQALEEASEAAPPATRRLMEHLMRGETPTPTSFAESPEELAPSKSSTASGMRRPANKPIKPENKVAGKTEMKPVKHVSVAVGPTTYDTCRGRGYAGRVMLLAQKTQ